MVEMMIRGITVMGDPVVLAPNGEPILGVAK